MASSVLPVPGGPTSSTPLGMRAPSEANFCGSLRNSTTSCELLLGLVGAGDVVEGDGGLVAGEHARPALAEGERLIARPLRLTHQEDEEACQEQHGQY